MIRSVESGVVATMAVADILAQYVPGDEHEWGVEFAWLRDHHSEALRELSLSIQEHGIREPVVLGDDGRVWDGHHRLLVANTLGLNGVPVTSP